MRIGVPKESFKGETRVALTPASALELQKLGYDCMIQKGAGKLSGFNDKDYSDAGVTVTSAEAIYKEADVIAKVRPPSSTEVSKLKKGQTLISFFYPA